LSWRALRQLPLLPKAARAFENWIELLFAVTGLSDGGREFRLRAGGVVRTHEGVDSVSVAVVWLKRDDGPPPQGRTVVDIGAGSLDLLFGSLSRGLTREVLKLDDRVLGVRMKEFNGRMVGGVLLTLKLPVSNPDRIASLTIDVTGAITRPSQDSYIRLALRNFVLLRYDSAVEFAPADKNLLTWTFRSASLAHVSRAGEIRFEVIGDASGTDPVELLVDHIGVKLRLHAPE